MPYYKPLELLPKAQCIHILENLQTLRSNMKEKVPVRTNRSTLLLSTWNIREFSDAANRCEEAFWYISEIISLFDLVAVQEIGNNISSHQKVMSILGYKYDYIVTDTPNTQGGNERMAYIFNIGKVKFKNIAGEVSLDSKEAAEFNLPEGFARPPFIVAFQASWFNFYLCNVHIYYGNDSKDEDGVKDSDRRRREIRALALKLNKRAVQEDATYILMGDFNIEEKGDDYYTALVGDEHQTTGFFIHPKKDEIFTNAAGNKLFDQIAFNIKNITSAYLGIDMTNDTVNMGVVNFYDSVFQDMEYYQPIAKKLYEAKKKVFPDPWEDFNTWRTFQMSDHLPFWIELRIDFTDEYLQKMKETKEKET